MKWKKTLAEHRASFLEEINRISSDSVTRATLYQN